jgi:transcription-repair coupling factor (superfamily II helicase)
MVLDKILEASVVKALPNRLKEGRVLSLSGVAAGGLPMLAMVLHRLLPDYTVLVVVDGLKAQEQFEQDLSTWLNLAGEAEPGLGKIGSGPLYFPSWEILPGESRLPQVDILSDRLAAITRLRAVSSKPRPMVLASVPALLQRTFAPAELDRNTRTLRRGDTQDPLDLIEWLEDRGYEPEAQVTQKGELALRGGILDVFPLTSPWPVRLEFFGNELDSLRSFDPETQMSIEPIDTLIIPPGGEYAMLQRRVESASGGEKLELGSLMDYLPRQTVVLACAPEKLSLAAQHYEQQLPAHHPLFLDWDTVCQNWLQSGFACVNAEEGGIDQPLFVSAESFFSSTAHVPELPVAEARRRESLGQLHRWLRQGYEVHVFFNNSGEQQRFEELWQAGGFEGTETGPGNRDEFEPKRIPVLVRGALSQGFLCEDARLVVVTDAEVLGRYKVQRPRRLRSNRVRPGGNAQEIRFTELQEGDYVVHVQYGIGIFQGLQVLPQPSTRQAGQGSMREGRAAQECLVIEYASREVGQPAPRLFVPVHEAHLVSKYIGASKARPPLSVMGSARWVQAKAHAEQAVRDLAGELLAIQAARNSQPGHAFPADTHWQREFESAFLYEETPDQWRAIQDTKRDLEASRPMDRLICGDAGFGKTEVALRAAFKVVMGGKQVAILVPTTVLAQQHFNTFRERLADYPVRIELLSRYRSHREQSRVLPELGSGAVDVVIGTHRLLQDDVEFKNLGLVVIDEEQRFGVMHKEKFKRLRHLVDVLTLSATPIPRTLYLALTGARDMSTLETPPQDRLPVETQVAPYDERVIRDAIQRELNRQGQVFYLHNRVQSIEAVGMKLRALVPEARIAIGHGQMKSHQLESVMRQFVNGEVDVLLSTTIIESGLDIPNANTIIIDRADRFGLSDLYQLRGRVGRYKHQAYAYFLLPRHASLLADARKRISAIKQYSRPGSGFKIALRDLEIRGAGDLLGIEQSGHIAAVGFELYCQLLKQSINALKGLPVKPRLQIELCLDFISTDPHAPRTLVDPHHPDSAEKEEDWHIEVPREVAVYLAEDDPLDTQSLETVPSPVIQATAAFPLDYIGDAAHRIEVYRKLASINTIEEMEFLRSELKDRFGPLPEPAILLLQLTELKIAAAQKGISSIETRAAKLMLMRQGEYVMVGGRFPRLQKSAASAKVREILSLIRAF